MTHPPFINTVSPLQYFIPHFVHFLSLNSSCWEINVSHFFLWWHSAITDSYKQTLPHSALYCFPFYRPFQNSNNLPLLGKSLCLLYLCIHFLILAKSTSLIIELSWSLMRSDMRTTVTYGEVLKWVTSWGFINTACYDKETWYYTEYDL